MSNYQKHVRFQFFTSLLIFIAAFILLLIPLTRPGYLGAFGLLGLLGLGETIFHTRGNDAADEREENIKRRASVMAYAFFWLALVVWYLLALFVFSEAGQIPWAVVAPVIPVGYALVAFIQSLTSLVLETRAF